MKLGKARAIIFLVAAKENVDIFEYSPNTVKKFGWIWTRNKVANSKNDRKNFSKSKN